MRAVAIAALSLSLILGTTQTEGRSTEQQAARPPHLEAVAAVDANRGGPCRTSWDLRPRGDSQVHAEIVDRTRWLFACAFERFYPAQKPTALRVLDCESGWPWSHQHDSWSYKGAIQYAVSTFHHAYDTVIASNHRRSSWNLSRRVYNPRSQALVTALLVRRSSWSPWSCA